MYAVVVFTKESSDTFKSVQEIPVSWLSEDRKFCRWPPKNSCIYTANNVQPQDDWPWHSVEVEIICDSLKEAQKRSKKEVSTDEEQLGKGFRAPKPKDYYSPDTSVPRRRMDKDQYEFPPTLESMNNCVAPVTVERMNSFLPGEHYVNTVISNRQNHIDIVEPTNLESVNSEETLLTELGVLSDADEISSSDITHETPEKKQSHFECFDNMEETTGAEVTPFSKHLIYSAAVRQVGNSERKEKLPSAISCQEWRLRKKRRGEEKENRRCTEEERVKRTE
ncbi:uncharacterized protein LOC108910721 [Anoplophora glabripennis]|uniref:uncharacterized protein LOC108910721 n=1 Tax=Anoplophora glabripennis TaxID=217634 RepID=UPI000C780E6A|nr:uncharacterized protein LOC108910721 [Anoplophora glabripennis]